jgi:hypothetical protein
MRIQHLKLNPEKDLFTYIEPLNVMHEMYSLSIEMFQQIFIISNKITSCTMAIRKMRGRLLEGYTLLNMQIKTLGEDYVTKVQIQNVSST